MNPTVSLALATLAFVGTHLLMSHPLRDALVARLRYRGFLGLYSLVALATLVWVIVTWRAAESSPLWVAPLWWWPFASALMLVASILLVGSMVRNPALPHPGVRPRDIPPPRA